MSKRFLFLTITLLCICSYAYSIDAWIRINQLGYLPHAQKKAIFLSETPQTIKQFTIHDALTNEVMQVFSSSTAKGEFEQFKSTYSLDFSEFNQQGAFYIKAGLVYSPTIYINKNVYLGTADYVLNYFRQQRCSSSNNDSLSHKTTHYISLGEKNSAAEIITSSLKDDKKPKAKKLKTSDSKQELPELITIQGGWTNAKENIQYSHITANVVFQLLFAYQTNPGAYADLYNSEGIKLKNGTPDILDEAKWGLQWLLKMYPTFDSLYVQLNDDSKKSTFTVLSVGKTIAKPDTLMQAHPAFLATGKPQGLFEIKNKTTGIASLAAKFATAFALGASLFEKSDPLFASNLNIKAVDAYDLGADHPGVCQSVPGENNNYHQEANWADDMELAAMQLYRLTYTDNYLIDAAKYGRMEPISPWLCSQTLDNSQWYPYINYGHYNLANVENPQLQKEFMLNLQNGIQRMSLYAQENPFGIGTPFTQNSNSLISSLATQCKLYRGISNDSTYFDMETALIDWLLGKNPWGACMIEHLPEYGKVALATQFSDQPTKSTSNKGALTSGAMNEELYKSITDGRLLTTTKNRRFQSEWAVYNVDNDDKLTKHPSLDGTATLSYLLADKQKEGVGAKSSDKNQYLNGAIVKTDTTKKQISLVFSGHEFADGYKTISKSLKQSNIKAAFFFTGDFYRKSGFKKVIKKFQKDGHCLGAQSDKHLLCSSLQNRDSLNITKAQFLKDLRENYKAMEKFNIQKNEFPFFVPSYECYNDSISKWSREVGIQLIAPTPGTLSNMDNTIPEMRQNYYTSIEIVNKIKEIESKTGLNGNILLFHVGTDKRRQDKFYKQLHSLIVELSKKGYEFVDLYKATDVVDRVDSNTQGKGQKNKRKN